MSTKKSDLTSLTLGSEITSTSGSCSGSFIPGLGSAAPLIRGDIPKIARFARNPRINMH